MRTLRFLAGRVGAFDFAVVWVCTARALALGLVLLTAAAAGANGPEIGFDAGEIVPLGNHDVQLVREEVTVPVEGGRVHCGYTLKNLSARPLTISIGFVTNVPWPSGSSASFGGANLEVRRFGKLLPVRVEAVAKERWAPYMSDVPDSLPVFELTFGPHEESSLNISYWATPSGGCGGNDCGQSMEYHASTARLWAGTVEHASIRFVFSTMASLYRQCVSDSASCFTLRIEPGGYEVSAGEIVWTMTNWEPDVDFRVTIDWNTGESR